MSVAYYSKTPNTTLEQVNRVRAFIREQLAGRDVPSDGGLFHADGPTDDGGWWSFDLFEADEHFTRWHEDVTAPAFAQAGMEVQFRRLEVDWDSTQGVPG